MTAEVLILLAFALTLLQGMGMWLSVVGWFILLRFFLKKPESKLYALFFFASFFHISGYFPNPFLSMKHFHLTMALIILVDLFQGRLIPVIKAAFRPSLLWFVYGVWLIAFISGVLSHSDKAIKLSLNWLLVLALISYFVQVLARTPQALRKGLIFFVIGTCIQCLIAHYNERLGHGLFDLNILHNNHLALLLNLTLFYVLWLYLTEQSASVQRYLLGALLLMMGTLGISQSRTGWMSFLIGFVLFFFWIICDKNVPTTVKSRLAILAAVPLLMFDICMMRSEWAERLCSLGRLINGEHVHVHGDLFGRYKPELLTRVFETTVQEQMLGRGFQHWVTDIHSLYLVLFAAAGIIGLALFLVFIAGHILGLFQRMNQTKEWRLRILLLATLSAFVCWVTTSVTETFFLQFYVWVSVVIGLFLLTKGNKQAHDF